MMRRFFGYITSLIAGTCLLLGNIPAKAASTNNRPNILLIVVDDLGFNDLGIFGSEIETPNIDSLAGDGVVLTNFHTSPNCSPTRAMLLSGTDHHRAGLGGMAETLAPNQVGQPGYEGYLNYRIAALPELLRDAGYHTYMTGKWHLGKTPETNPAARGFEKSFVLLEGGAGAFANMLSYMGTAKAMYTEDGHTVETLPDDFYSTRFYTRRMIEYIDANRKDDRPFFAYLAYTAPHWPLQAPQESIAKYKGKYDTGYDTLREQRLQRLKELGLVAQTAKPFPRLPGQPAWEELSEHEKRVEAKKMEIYAAMVDDIDIYLGELIGHLKRIHEYDNTLIFFMSDNGPEGHRFERSKLLSEWAARCCDNNYENMGNPDSYIWYGPNWAQAGNTPLRMYKGFTSQGGVRVPAFIHYPKSLPGSIRDNELLTVMDVMPTLLDAANIEHPGKRHPGRPIETMIGASMWPKLTGAANSTHDKNYTVGWELFSKRALRQGDWKIVYLPYHERYAPLVSNISANSWQLYNLAKDPSEIHDLANEHPDKLQTMIKLWDKYARENGVILPNRIIGY